MTTSGRSCQRRALVCDRVTRHRPQDAHRPAMKPLATPPADRPGPEFRGVYRDDLAARSVYAEAAGIARVMPRAVAVPADADDVVALIRWANETRAPLVPRGSGSSMPSGAIGAGVIVDVSRMITIESPDIRARRIVVGPGALRNQVDARAQSVGLRFPVDPSSGAFCSLGGMVSTNAAGARTLRYGSTRRWVTALDCVFADGSRATIRRGAPPPRVDAVDSFLAEVAPSIRSGGAALRNRTLRKNS